MRATVDRPGLDSHGRSSKIQVRRIRKGDLSRTRDVLEQAFADLFERQLGTRPRQAFGGAQYVHHRWLMEPWGCFVAEEEGGRLLGVALAVTWGTVGLIGPVAVLTNYQNQGIGQQLIGAVERFFQENRTALQGLATYPTSPKHLALFHKFGYKPKQLTAIMSRALERGAPRAGPSSRPARAPLGARKFSTLEEARKKVVLARAHRIAGGLCRGMDLSKEIEIVDGLALGDTLILERDRDVVGFAIYHVPGVSEAPAGALYVKFLGLEAPASRPEHLEQAVSALEEMAQELGLARVILPVYLGRWLAYSTLVRCGYQIDVTLVRMLKGKGVDHEDESHLVLDDWR